MAGFMAISNPTHPIPASPPPLEVELTISTLTNMGQGLGRIDGWVVLVPYALPGELVRARIYTHRANYSEADLLEVRVASPDRIAPACPLFGRCGGCQYQHLEYRAELEWKQRQVAELLRHMAGLSFPVEPVIASPRPYGYRSKLTPHFQKPSRGDHFPIGFLETGRRSRLVDVPHCPIATEGINDQLSAERDRIRSRAHEFRKGATLLLREAKEGVVTDASAVITEEVNGLRFRFPAGEFFQNNPFLLPAFVNHVVTQAVSDGSLYLVDAYCGSGLFALAGAASFRQVIGLEVSEASIRWARRNAELNSIQNCQFEVGDAATLFREVKWPPAATTVIMDPPRKGATDDFLRQVVALGPKTLVYVSCNPATQMRDLRTLAEGGYVLQLVQPFDMFPQTRHLECILTLRRL